MAPEQHIGGTTEQPGQTAISSPGILFNYDAYSLFFIRRFANHQHLHRNAPFRPAGRPFQ